MKTLLTHRLSQSEIKELCALTHGARNNHLKEELYQFTLDDDRRVAVNALWTFTHFAAADNVWLFAKHDQLIDRCLNEKDTTKLRLILTLLLRQPFDEEAIRTDFIDFCLVCLIDARAPYAIRALCIKLAYEQMKYWSELLNELRQMLDLISNEPLSPGLRSAWRQVMNKIKA
ncbi:hypothetical protein [Leyella stercorea]|uniref:hypothetical protein n=1 Tax=Leyella stercorea TaxID=363265 RepID=UPI00242A5D98|nr:hypothetical protein [Leyella stercorea]